MSLMRVACNWVADSVRDCCGGGENGDQPVVQLDDADLEDFSDWNLSEEEPEESGGPGEEPDLPGCVPVTEPKIPVAGDVFINALPKTVEPLANSAEESVEVAKEEEVLSLDLNTCSSVDEVEVSLGDEALVKSEPSVQVEVSDSVPISVSFPKPPPVIASPVKLQPSEEALPLEILRLQERKKEVERALLPQELYDQMMSGDGMEANVVLEQSKTLAKKLAKAGGDRNGLWMANVAHLSAIRHLAKEQQEKEADSLRGQALSFAEDLAARSKEHIGQVPHAAFLYEYGCLCMELPKVDWAKSKMLLERAELLLTSAEDAAEGQPLAIWLQLADLAKKLKRSADKQKWLGKIENAELAIPFEQSERLAELKKL